LQTAAKAFDDAQLHHDRALIDRFLAPDFQYVTRNGRLLRRDAFIANITTPGEALRPFVVAGIGSCRWGATAGWPAATPSCAAR
jgi:hypothetical protein